MDADSDGYVTVAEIQQRMELDDDQDGEVRNVCPICRKDQTLSVVCMNNANTHVCKITAK